MVVYNTVWASAGCGKTKFCTDLAAKLIEDGACLPHEVLYSTFQKTAAEEAARRSGIGAEEGKQLWYRTLHSVCYRLLGLKYGSTVTPQKMRGFGALIGVDVNQDLATEDDEAADLAKVMMAMDRIRMLADDPATAINKLLAMYQFSRLTATSVSDLEASKREPSSGALRFFTGSDWSRYDSIVETYEGWKKKNGLVDFVDMLERVLREPVQIPFWKVVFIDEAQDLNSLQWLVVMKLAEQSDYAFFAGDDWQCLPGDEQILTPSGPKAIKEIKAGETVVSGVKSGKTGVFRVLRKFERMYEGEILEIETESGVKVKVTPNHHMFVHWKFRKHCVYLMRQGEFWRIGMSQNVHARNALEVKTDGVMPISVHDSMVDARKSEILTSLRSGIPTVLFPTRHVGTKNLLPFHVRKSIFEEADTAQRAKKLLEELGRTWAPILKKATWRGGSRRRILNVYPLEFDGHNPMVEFQSGETRKESNAVRKYFNDLGRARRWISEQEIDAPVFERWAFLAQKVFYRIEARNLLPDVCLLPVVRDGRTVMERVKSIKKSKYSGLVYDLEVEKSHNFCANGIVVSNCIMSFQGSCAESFLSFRGRSNEIHLPQTHRFGQEIIDLGQKIVSRLTNSMPKALLPAPGRRNEIHRIWDFGAIQEVPGKKFLLHRYRQGCNSICSELIMKGLPFWAERGVNPLGRGAEIGSYQAVSRLMKGLPITGFDLKCLLDAVPAKMQRGGEMVRLIKHGSIAKLKEIPDHDEVRKFDISDHFTEEFWAALLERDWSIADIKFSEYYKALEESGWVLGGEKEPDITVTTIHGSKGRESDSVFVWDETLPKCLVEEGEHRVAYVAATRTRGPLYIMSSPVTSWNTQAYDYPIGDRS